MAQETHRTLIARGRKQQSTITVGAGFLWRQLNQRLSEQTQHGNVFLITDSNLAARYCTELEGLGRSLSSGYHQKIFPAGEATAKSRANKKAIEDFVLEKNAAQSSFLVAFGGGVVGDVVGYAAATLFRGVGYAQVPTSLMAMVDSSVGGKTGINTPQGKNVLGAFHLPKNVWTDVALLKTLPENEFIYGLAEVFKIAIMLDKKLLHFLRKIGAQVDQQNEALMFELVRRSIAAKSKVVRKDFWNNNYRHVLNFGHTTAHAIEVLSGYEIPHGKAVLVGMLAEAFLSKELQILSAFDFEVATNLLMGFPGFKTLLREKPPFGGLSPRQVVEQMSSDKKNRLGGHITMPLVAGLGKPHKARTGYAANLKTNEVLGVYEAMGKGGINVSS